MPSHKGSFPPPVNGILLKQPNGGEKELEEEDDDEVYCGIGPCRPGSLQCCATMGVFSCVYSLSGLLTSTIAMYVNSQITTLEKQFGFSSSISGFILSCNDIGYLLTTLFMSYIARRTHIPRVLGLSTILFGLSGIICSIPYFVTKDDLHPVVNTSGVVTSQFLAGEMCSGQGHNMSDFDLCSSDSSDSKSFIDTPASTRSLAVVLLATGMILQGFGKSPRYPFLATYVDDNVDKTKTTLYLGVITGLGIFGPAMAFVLGGLFSKMYVTLEETTMTPRDPRWIGAWWLGFVVFGFSSLVSSIPLFFFPRRMRSRDPAVEHTQTSSGVCSDVKGLLKSVMRLLTNPIYMCLVLATCLNLFAISGMIAFLPKYIEVQFQIPAWKANIILGALNVIGAAGGSMIGGIITSKCKLRPITCVLFILCISVISVSLSALGFFLGCDQPDIVGYNTQTVAGNISVSECGETCGCSDTYFPVCGENGINYYSPCHAGCASSIGQLYTNCTCIPGGSTAAPALCESGCSSLHPYIAIMFIAAFTATLGMMPGFNATIRCVSEQDKPLAIGLSAFLNTLLGWFPGPVSFGKMIDTTCIQWTTSCSGSGACAMYNLVALKVRYHIMFVVTRASALGLYIATYVVARCSKRPFYGQEDVPVVKSPEAQEFIVKNGTNAKIRHSKV